MIGKMTTWEGASLGGNTNPLSSLCVIINPPINRVLTPQEVVQAYSSWPSLLKNLTEITKPVVEEGGAYVSPSASGGPASRIDAVYYDSTETIKLLLDKGADVNAKGSKGRTPLMHAAIGGETEIAKLLIEKGADVNAGSDKGETALSLAISRHNDAIVQLLRKAGGA